MTKEITFDDWWRDFENQSVRNREEPTEMLRRLKTEVKSLPEQKRTAFIDELLSRKELMILAFELIPSFGDKGQILNLKKLAYVMINSEPPNYSILDSLMNAVVQSYQMEDKEIVTKYYVDFQESNFVKVPIELYEKDKTIFLQAFEKCIKLYPIDKLCDYDGLLFLIEDIDALTFLIENLSYFPARKLKIFCLAKANHSFASNDKRLKIKLLELAELKESEIDFIKKRRISDLN
jgi:hypothetical protein